MQLSNLHVAVPETDKQLFHETVRDRITSRCHFENVVTFAGLFETDDRLCGVAQ